MARRIGDFVCIDCGVQTRRRIETGRKMVCLECGIRRSVTQVRMLAEGRRQRREAARLVALKA